MGSIETTLVVCAPLPKVGSTVPMPPDCIQRPCADCGTSILMSPATLRHVAGLGDFLAVCVACGQKRAPDLSKVNVMPLSAEQVVELLAAINRDRESEQQF